MTQQEAKDFLRWFEQERGAYHYAARFKTSKPFPIDYPEAYRTRERALVVLGMSKYQKSFERLISVEKGFPLCKWYQKRIELGIHKPDWKMNKAGQTFRQWVPREFFAEYMDTRAAKLLDTTIVDDIEHGHPLYNRCPIDRKNIHHWCIVSDGTKYWAVAWNENPSVGWSFPVKRIWNIKQYRYGTQ